MNFACLVGVLHVRCEKPNTKTKKCGVAGRGRCQAERGGEGAGLKQTWFQSFHVVPFGVALLVSGVGVGFCFW